MKKKLHTAAIVTIYGAPRMNWEGKRKIARWLRRQADFLEKHNKELSERFTARWEYEGRK